MRSGSRAVAVSAAKTDVKPNVSISGIDRLSRHDLSFDHHLATLQCKEDQVRMFSDPKLAQVFPKTSVGAFREPKRVITVGNSRFSFVRGCCDPDAVTPRPACYAACVSIVGSGVGVGGGVSGWSNRLLTRTPSASRIRLARSTVMLWYSARSSREIWDSCTPSRDASSRWVSPRAMRKATRPCPSPWRFSISSMSPRLSRSSLSTSSASCASKTSVGAFRGA